MGSRSFNCTLVFRMKLSCCPLSLHLIAQDRVTVHLKKAKVLLNVAPSHEGHQVEKANRIEAGIPPLLLF